MPSSTDPAGALLRIEAELATRRQLSPESAELLLSAISAVATGNASTLEEALGLSAPGRPGYRTGRGRIIQRALLIATARAIPMPEGATTWARAQATSRALHQFETRTWPRWRSLRFPPPSAAGTWRARAFGLYLDAADHGLAVPTSARTIYRLLMD